MPKDRDYFEEAMSFSYECSDEENKMLQALYWLMLDEYQNKGF